jgi:hypothetical protein
MRGLYVESVCFDKFDMKLASGVTMSSGWGFGSGGDDEGSLRWRRG